MLKLMKYEFRKTLFTKLILLVITGVMEILFLCGVFLKWDDGLGFGILGLTLCATIGITWIGIYTLLLFHRDLNTKQSYMLFLTPHSSYEILGAKVLENAVSLFLGGVFYGLLAAIDIAVATLYIGGLKELIDLLQQFLASVQIEVTIDPIGSALAFASVLTIWLLNVVIGMMAIVFAAAVMAGRKLSGFVSFLLYLALSVAASWLLNLIPGDSRIEYSLLIACALLLTAGMYLLTGWIMEKKLSV